MSRIHFAAIEGFEAIDAVFADFLERLSGRPLAAELAAAAGISRSAMNNRLRALRERAAQMRASGITEPPEL